MRLASLCIGLFVGGCVSIGSSDGCGGPISVRTECETLGGNCDLSCTVGRHAEQGYGCFLDNCCLPGATCEDNGGACVVEGCGAAQPMSGYCGIGKTCCPATDAAHDAAYDAAHDAPAEASSGGTCDGDPCAAGCACGPSADAGARGVCACATDAGTDASTDASPDAATDAASDASSDAPPASEPCGVITCVDGCVCADRNASACVCQ